MVGVCMLSTILAGARSVLAYLVILLYIVIAAPLGSVIALVFRWKQGLYTLGHWGAWLALNLVGIRYRVIGPEYLNTESVVFCSNHESNVDPPVLFNALHRRLHVFYKAELHKFPLMGTVFDVGGFDTHAAQGGVEGTHSDCLKEMDIIFATLKKSTR